ncbi:hypothetical protein FB446DRAFT_794044 [Lentinula raphanica]|nr:hypothetical protein FB446DRAFT_794044 [Lentinula raphanica]
MHFNSSVFYALMCLSAIVHTACGSPVPASSDRADSPTPPGGSLEHASSERAGSPSPPSVPLSRNRPVQGSSAPHNPSASEVEPAGPALSIGLPTLGRPPRQGSQPFQHQHPPLWTRLSTRELSSLIVKYIEAGLKFYGPRELGSFILELRTHPHRDIHFYYPGPDNNPETYVPIPAYIQYSSVAPIQYVGYNFAFSPRLLCDTTTIENNFWGSGTLSFGFSRAPDLDLIAHTTMLLRVFEKVDKSRKASPDNTLLRNHTMFIASYGRFQFVNTIPGDRSGRGLEVKDTGNGLFNRIRGWFFPQLA